MVLGRWGLRRNSCRLGFFFAWDRRSCRMRASISGVIPWLSRAIYRMRLNRSKRCCIGDNRPLPPKSCSGDSMFGIGIGGKSRPTSGTFCEGIGIAPLSPSLAGGIGVACGFCLRLCSSNIRRMFCSCWLCVSAGGTNVPAPIICERGTPPTFIPPNREPGVRKDPRGNGLGFEGLRPTVRMVSIPCGGGLPPNPPPPTGIL